MLLPQALAGGCRADVGTVRTSWSFEMPKILQHTASSRSSPPEPQLAEQLVGVPTPSPALLPVPQMEHQLVEVPPIVPQLVGFFAGAMGTCGGSSRGLQGTTGGGWAPLTPSGPLHRGAPPGQGGIQILALGDRGRPCDHAVCVPAVQVVRVLCRDSVHRQSAGPSSCATEEIFYCAVLEQGC